MLAAGIVLYNPDIQRLKENIDAIIKQVDYIILVDNNSKNKHEIKTFIEEYGIEIINNDNNFGIAKALNQIMLKCKEKKYSWVLTMDQDSVVASNIIIEYSKYLDYPGVAIISPLIKDRNYLESSTLYNKFDYIEKCITSGALTSIEVWDKINGFDEYMFIDLVDFEYCYRVRTAGYKIVRVNTTAILHQLGELEVKKICNKKIFITNHSPIRCYYYARNCIFCYKKHSDIGIYITVTILMKKIIKIIIFENEKKTKFSAIVRGIIDGYRKI